MREPSSLSTRGRALLVSGTALGVYAADQLTKSLAVHYLAHGPRQVAWKLQWNLQYNTGMSFSLATGSTGLITVLTIVEIAVLVGVAVRARSRLTAVVLGLLLGGAAGNLSDRLLRHHHGGVVDFIDFRFWPVFNLADSAVDIAIAILVARALFGGRRAPAATDGLDVSVPHGTSPGAAGGDPRRV